MKPGKFSEMIVIVLGLPGSGKSYFAERLAGTLNAGYVNSDRLRKQMFATRMYTQQEKDSVYTAMLKKVKEALSQNRSIVLDATFHRAKTRQLFISEVNGKENILFIEVWAAEDIIRERLKNARPDSEADFEIYRLIQQQWEPLKETHLLLESSNSNIENMLQAAAAYLQQKNDK